METTRIAVMGAGAVGCYYGAMLARAGNAVTLIGRPQHVDAVSRDGLLLEMQGRREPVPMRASVSPQAIAGARLVLFCVKSADTESAGEAMRPHLHEEAVVVSLQNGVDNGERLQAVLGRSVIPAVVYVAVGMAGPGHVQHHGRGELLIGASLGSERIAALLTAAQIPTEVAADARGPLWAKLIINCAFNALSAIPQMAYGRLIDVEGVREVMHDVVEECLAVARAAGVEVPGDLQAALEQIAATMSTQRSSTAQDLAAGKRSEIDYLNGYIVRRGRELGVRTPVNRVLHTLVRLVESTAGD